MFIRDLLINLLLLAAVGAYAESDDSWIYSAQIGADYHPEYGPYMNVENIWFYTNFFYSDKYMQENRKNFISEIRKAHKKGLKVITYTGPLEVITEHADRDGDGKVDKGVTTFSMRHPDYMQIGISGRKAALLGSVVGEDSFWVDKDAEDAWLTPNHPDVLKASIDHVLKLAAFGVDGIWLDVPHMNSWWVEGVWEDEYPSYDKYSIELFKEKYGYPPPHKIDWCDEKWRNWIDFRYWSITNFISKINSALHKQYPDCKLIIEHWMGVGADSADKACSAYLIRDVCDIRGHEVDCATYSKKSQKYYNLMRDMALFKFYREIDHPDPTWILAYADSHDASLMLNAIALTAGVNLYEADPPEMEGCVDPALRHRIFSWLQSKNNLFFAKELTEPVKIGLFYSTASEFYGDPSWEDDISHTDSFFGLAIMLMRLGVPFKVITDTDVSGVKKVIVPHRTFETEAERRVLAKIASKAELIKDSGNLGWKFWKAAKIGANWESSVSEPPDRERCKELQATLKKIMDVTPIVEFDSDTDIVPRIFYDKKRDVYILKVINLKGQNAKNIKAVPQTVTLRVNIPASYKMVKEYSFLDKQIRHYSLDRSMTVKGDINLFSVFEFSK